MNAKQNHYVIKGLTQFKYALHAKVFYMSLCQFNITCKP